MSNSEFDENTLTALSVLNETLLAANLQLAKLLRQDKKKHGRAHIALAKKEITYWKHCETYEYKCTRADGECVVLVVFAVSSGTKVKVTKPDGAVEELEGGQQTKCIKMRENDTIMVHAVNKDEDKTSGASGHINECSPCA